MLTLKSRRSSSAASRRSSDLCADMITNPHGFAFDLLSERGRLYGDEHSRNLGPEAGHCRRRLRPGRTPRRTSIGSPLRWILQCHRRGQNASIARVSRYQSRTKDSIDGGDTFGRFAGEFHTGEDCATGIRSCGAIGDKGSIDAIGSAILLGVGARNWLEPASRP
jgi:hypothetical protein